MIRIAAISDPHVGRKKLVVYQYDRLNFNSEEAVLGTEIERRLEMAVSQINNKNFDFTVIAGDITESAMEDQFMRAAEILNNLKKPLIPLMGNHDLWSYCRNKQGQLVWQAQRQNKVCEFESYFSDWKNKMENFVAQGNAFQNYTFTFDDIRIVIVDNINRRQAFWGFPGTSAFPKLHQKSRDWLQKQLTISREKRIVIFSHAGLNINSLEKLNRTTDAALINICGHSHKSSNKKKGNIRALRLPAFYLSPKILEIELGKRKTCFFMNQIFYFS